MTEIQEYYPNKEGLINEANGKPFRYVYKGEGFTNKRTLHAYMVKLFLEERGIHELDKVVENGLSKLSEVYPDDSDDDLVKKLNIGFFNRTTSQINYDLEEVEKEMSNGDVIELMSFSMPHGQPSRLDGFVLTNQHLTDEGQKLIGSKVPSGHVDNGIPGSIGRVDYTQKVSEDPLEDTYSKDEKSQILSGQISTDPLA